MKKQALLLLVISGMVFSAYSQNASVKGVISDTISKINLQNAVISLLRKKDSVLQTYTRANEHGSFEMSDLSKGKYILLITYPDYADYADTFSLAENSSINLGMISMITKAHLLQEVIVKQSISAIRLKGDTTEYKADSFHVQADASVEDLLKKLPGIQVDKTGQITAQGEKVQKVLVDGEEFFGDDPTLVTQNIRADMVDKVQVFDKKSDQATFTGIDDGQKTKTINLKLKDDKKNGYFGKINAGAATGGYHDNQALFNSFRKKQKFAAYGIVSNTGKTGLNWQDQNSTGTSDVTTVITDGGDSYSVINSDDITGWGGNYNGQGKPLVQTGGLHFNNKWNDDKQSINLNYKALQLQVDGQSNTSTEYILPDTLYYNNQTQNFNNKVLRNKINGTYEVEFDSTSSLKVVSDGTLEHKSTINNYSTEALTKNSKLVNNGNRNITADGDNNYLNTDILWRKRLQKKGRTISIDFKENYSMKASAGNLFAQNNFYTDGNPTPSMQTTDQYKTSNNKLLAFDSKFTYTEPLSSASSLVANYELIINNSLSNRSSFNKDANGLYKILDSTYSNDYTFNYLTHKTGLAYSFINKKIRFNIGNNLGFTNFTQQDNYTNIQTGRNFINWFPQTRFNYLFTSQKSLSFSYNGNTTQPSLLQIQPVKTNDDPLNITIGNAALKPSFTNNFDLNFQDYKTLENKFFYVHLNYRFIENEFSTNDNVDSSGRRVSQTINVNGNYSLSGFLNYYFKIKKPELRLGFNGDFNINQNANIINGLTNITNSSNYTFGLFASQVKEKKLDNSIRADATYTTSTSSIQQNITTHYWTYTIHPDLDFYFSKKWHLHTDCDFIFRQKTSVFDNNNNVIFWNLWFDKKVLKSNALMIRVSANDILNQNKGFNRTVNSNFISQNTYTTIQRYFMLSVIWNFNKNNPTKEEDWRN
ncbi:MAG: outer membrane beta-barrel protein [Bacteroidota bacterium]|nr:outer membrane beta-barrel protein [Bacteroidota bacterium]